MFVILLVPLLVIGSVVAMVLRRRHGRVEPVAFLRAMALSLAVLFTLFAGLFIVGETADDPGGGAAVALVAAWLVPMIVLVLLAWRWPGVAGVVLGVLVAVIVASGVWYALDTDAWRAFEDSHGPVRAVAVFALSLPLAVLAWRRPVLGGALLLIAGVVPGVLAMLATGRGGAPYSTVAASSPAAMIGVLYLVAGWMQRAGVPSVQEPVTPSDAERHGHGTG